MSPADPLARAFVGDAKAETLDADFNALRVAIRSWDAEATEKAWERCERWVSGLQVIRNTPKPLG